MTDDLLARLKDERRALAAEWSTFSDAQWHTPSALAGWQVRHVAAHLLWAVEASVPSMVGAFLKNGLNFNRTMDSVADADKRSPQQMASALSAVADQDKLPPGFGPAGMLMDTVVHGQDIRRALGLQHTFPKETLTPVCKRLMAKRTQKLFRVPRGFTFVATDIDLSRGEGPKVEAPAADLMMTLAGRKVALQALKGEGAESFRQQFREYA